MSAREKASGLQVYRVEYSDSFGPDYVNTTGPARAAEISQAHQDTYAPTPRRWRAVLAWTDIGTWAVVLKAEVTP